MLAWYNINMNDVISHNQKIVANYHAFLENEFGTVMDKNCKPDVKCIDGVAMVVWGIVMAEASHLLRDLSGRDSYDLFERQRSLYSQARFCMEAVADFNCMKSDSSQIDNFYNGVKKYREALLVMAERGQTEDGSSEVAELLRDAGRLSPNTNKRVEVAFPRQIQEYAILCYHTHLNAIGILHELKENKDEAIVDLIYQCFDVISSSIIKLVELVASTKGFAITDESKRALVEQTSRSYNSFLKIEAQ